MESERIRKLRAVCQPSKLDLSLYRRLVIRPVSIYLTAALHRLGASANLVSALKGLLAIAGAAMFCGRSVAWPAAGVLLLQLSYLLDACDGELARLHRTCQSAGGEYIDKLGDAASRGLQHLFWGVGAYRLGGRLEILLVGGILGCLWLVVRFCLVETVLESLAARPNDPPSRGQRRALVKCFVTRPESGRLEYLLSAVYHPWINMVTLAVAAELVIPEVRLGGSVLHTRGILLLAFAAAWTLNLFRKALASFSVADFRRPS